MTGRTAALATIAGLFLAQVSVGEDVILSSYVGGPGAEKLAAVAVLPDGTVVVGGGPAESKSGLAAPLGKGIMMRISATGERTAVVSMSGAVEDMDTDADGNLYVAGTFGSAKYDPQGKAVWTSNVGGIEARIAPGPAGSAVILAAKTVTVLNARGQRVRSLAIPAAYVNDVACDPVTQTVFVTGFDNKRGHSEPVQVAFVYAYNAEGRQAWKAYGWGGVEVDDQGLMADTRGYRLAMGGDGKLYVAGESAGGNTMWSRQSQDLTAKAGLAAGDKFQVAFNTSSNHITFIGRLDPKTGRSEGGTMLLARLTSGKGNTIRPRALAVDAAGQVYVGGASASYPPVSEGAFGSQFDGGGAFFCVFDSAFNRIYAAKFCSGAAAAVAAGRAAVAVVGETTENLTVVKPLQKAPGGGVDGWVVILPRPGGPAPAPAPAPASAPPAPEPAKSRLPLPMSK